MNDFDLNLLLDSVTHELSNPELPQTFRKEAFAMDIALPANVLIFRTVESIGPRRITRSAVATAAFVNIAALLLLAVQVRALHTAAPERVTFSALEAPPIPPPLPPAKSTAGGGGGSPGVAPVTRGNPPKFAPQQMVPPQAPPLIQPRLAIEPTIDVDPALKMAKTDLLTLGMPDSPLVGRSAGNGHGGGIGPGTGDGMGPGGGGNTGGGSVRRVGGGVSAPVVLFAPTPEFSEEARRAKISGNVLVYLQVDEQGRPIHVRVLRGIGFGLEERAIEAVQQYKFKPAYENGHPVRVEMNVEVNFTIM